MRELRILSSSLPPELGGLGLRLPELCQIASVLGRRCGASAMVFAMHESQIETARFGSVGNDHFQSILRDYAAGQKLVASITSEVGIGGNIRASNTIADPTGGRVAFEKQAPTVSYGEYADGFLITARRTEGADQSDQVFVYAAKDQVELEKLGNWDTIGMRGTCSPPFVVKVDAPAANVLDVSFGLVSKFRMEPWSIVMWAACWEGIATSAYDKAAHATRKKAKQQLASGQPLGDPRLTDAYAALQSLRALINNFARILDEHAEEVPDHTRAEAARNYAADAMALKINASMTASRVAEQCLEVIGMPGYSQTAPASVSREIRDLLGARMMVSNDRLRKSAGEILMMGTEV